MCTYIGNRGNRVSGSGFLLKMPRLFSHVDYGYDLLDAFVAQLVEFLTLKFIFYTNSGSNLL